MSGVYGNILDYFPELFTPVTFWSATRGPDGEYNAPPVIDEDGHVDVRTIPVIVLNDAGDMIKRKKFVDEWILDSSGNDVLYSYDDVDIRLGDFLIHPHTKEWNRIVARLGYSLPGGFSAWGIERVQGTDKDDTREVKPVEGMF